MEYSRRRFLGTAVAGMGALLLHSCHAASGNYDPYDIIEIGRTGIKTTRLSLGTGVKTMNQKSALARMEQDQAVKLVREMYERGVRMFDLAEDYGTHVCVGEALKNYPRSDYVIFTKMVPRNSPTAGEESPERDTENRVTRFLEDLQTDYIDGLQLHGWGFSGNWNTAHSEYMTAFDKLKEKGTIRAHGLSSHSLDAVKTAINEPWVDTMHVRFNAYGVNMDDTLKNVEPAVKGLHQAGKGVIAMKVLGEGAFANNDEQKDHTFNYVLRLGAVDVMTVGMEKISDIEDNESRIRKVTKG